MSEAEKTAEQFANDLHPGPHASLDFWYARKAAYLAGAAWQRERDIEAVGDLGCDQDAGAECPICLAVNAIRREQSDE